ncbi:MAG: KpsF/GutQ family sugar-phosphate isomerase [Spirochaetes bacterium]|nr:KpsF/GutQ family sugar-phosphate isomerase [Spirochaetota bacterium]
MKDLSVSLNDNFSAAVNFILKCKGRVVVTGMGKSGIICKKIAATLTSTGTQAIFMHPSEAMHGDLGLITRNDTVIAISHSGETREIAELIPHLKLMKTKIIAVTSNPDSGLAKEADVLLSYRIVREGCPLNLAPMASTTTVLALGDALAAALMKAKNVKAEDFYLFHPQGRLGQTLLCVSDLMVKENLPIIQRQTQMREVIKIMVSTNFGAVLIEGSKGHLRGIITDGDIKRLIEEDEYFLQKKAGDFVKINPKYIFEDSLAREALMVMEENRITFLPVLGQDKKIAGIIHIHDIVKHNYGRRK